MSTDDLKNVCLALLYLSTAAFLFLLARCRFLEHRATVDGLHLRHGELIEWQKQNDLKERELDAERVEDGEDDDYEFDWRN